MKYVGLVKHVETLIAKAGTVDSGMSNSADVALKFSQAALNAAHAIAVLEQTSEKRTS